MSDEANQVMYVIRAMVQRLFDPQQMKSRNGIIFE
jgi:hypothetical protein